MKEIFNAKGSLLQLVTWLKRQGAELDDPNIKESHKGKTLSQHVEECWSLAKMVLEKLGLDRKELKQICFSLCVAHDLGKLSPKWQVKTGGRHSTLSSELLRLARDKGELEKLLPLSKEYEPLLIFATLKHHSSLFPNSSNIFELKLDRELSKLLTNNIRLSIDLADVVGVFKLADIVSASNYPLDLVLSQFEWSDNLEGKIVSEVRRRAEQRRGFDYERFKLQSSIASSSGKYLMVVAPTGWGKTALALLRAKETKPNKVFYILPTITAIKEFEQQLQEIFGQDYVGEYFFFADVEYLVRREASANELVYPLDFYRLFVPKVVITTIDQLLLTTLQIGKYHLRRFNLRRSLLILDEFHLLTPEMVGALKAIFEILSDIYDYQVLLMTATPSSIYVDSLKDVLGGIKFITLKHEYERLRRHKVELQNKSLLDFLQERIDNFKGKRILVITNTVERAVKAYDILRGKLGSDVRLIHGRFAYNDRARKEDEAREARILISTQVAEVSLDISYDILITELAPIPSLIQRFGRVNRYGNKTENTNVYICSKLDSHKPYTDLEMLATNETLEKLLEGLQKRGESIYLDVLDDYYRRLLEKQDYVDKVYEQVRKQLENSMYFYSFYSSEPEEFLKSFGREPSYLAVPYPYLDKVRNLKELWDKEAKNYAARRRLMAEMKGYFISVPYFIRDGYLDEDLLLYVVGVKEYAYDPERGLVRRDSTR
ncbi:hypothetical protein ATG_15330 [Desulfurococcaceae archaeon AG1]|nr:hypothetical protein ATG_15330 [Desulfurococcaceae archaeon AG1]